MNKDSVSRVTSSEKNVAQFKAAYNPWEKERQLLIAAINNRTRERNYANLCLRLAEGRISEDEFDAEIDANEDRYVLSFSEATPPEDVALASRLADSVLDVDTEDDFRELFSIGHKAFSKALALK